MIDQLLPRISRLHDEVRRTRTVNINSAALKESAIQLAKTFFSNTRPQIASVVPKELLEGLDADFQDLVRLASANNAKNSYLKLLKSTKAAVSEARIITMTSVGVSDSDKLDATSLTPAEQLLLDTLFKVRPSAAASYEQGLIDLTDHNRLSYRGTASEFREALREVLDQLAPDGDVTSQEGFQWEPNRQGPTMKQKVRFILQSRRRSKTQTTAAEKAIELVDNLIGGIARAAYDRASLATHVESSRSEVHQIKRYVDAILYDLLEIKEVGVPPNKRIESRNA